MDKGSAAPVRPAARALISVTDKTGVAEFARALADAGIQIVSTGGTARLLADAGVPVTEVSSLTGFPEIMGGRLKTLHPAVHGGILARRGIDDEVLREHGMAAIDLVVVNLYRFEQTVSAPGCTPAQAIESIDIGGPTMLRAAAKNHESVTVVCDAGDYSRVLEDMRRNSGATSAALRFELAAKAFAHTAAYDAAIANWLTARDADGTPQDFPGRYTVQFERVQQMRYGENPHQRAAFYREPQPAEPCVATARVLQGKELSYNNIADADAALECVKLFTRPACVIVKHANPCGVAECDDIATAYDRAYATDPTSAFGGIIAFNRPLDADTAQAILARQFVEVIIAPRIEAAAVQALAGKKNVRVLESGDWGATRPAGLDYKRVSGGLLVQDRDIALVQRADLRVVTRRQPTPVQFDDLLFAWKVAKFVKSNAIVYASDSRTLGIGAGQMSRVDSARIGLGKAADAGLVITGAVMASDAFFPFRDGVDAAAAAGVAAVIQPGGSMRDEEVIAAADEHGLAMVFTGMRHFRH